MSSQEICEQMISSVSLCEDKFTNSKIVVSSITPRKDDLNENVKLANQFTNDELSKEIHRRVVIVDNSNLDDPPYCMI